MWISPVIWDQKPGVRFRKSQPLGFLWRAAPGLAWPELGDSGASVPEPSWYPSTAGLWRRSGVANHGKMTWKNHGKPWNFPWINSIKDGCVTCRWFDEIVTFLGGWFFLHGKHGLRLWSLKMRSSCRFAPLKPILAVLVIVDEWGRTAHVWK